MAEAALHGVGVMAPIGTGSSAFLAWARRYWVSWGGLVFPLFDPLGAPVGLEIRRLPRVVEPGRNPYADFQITRQTGVPLAFGFPHAVPAIWETRRVILVEGVFDYFGVRAAGYAGVLANLTAAVASPMRRFLGRHAQVVVSLLDMDPAGRTATQRLTQVGVDEGFLVVAPCYPAKDVGTLLQRGDVHVLARMLAC